MEEATITVEKMAKRLNIGLTMGYELVHSKGFYPAFRIGRKILINTERLQQWLNEQAAPEK